MITIINEKRSQAEDYAKYLGGMTGTMPNESMFPGEPYKIVFAAGHLYKFDDLKNMVDNPENFTSWSLNDLPFDRKQINWRKVVIPGKEKFLAPITIALSKSDKAIISTDNDPSGEGDMIGWEILKGLNFKGEVYRDHHRTQQPDSLRETFKTLIPVTDQDGTLLKAEAREKFDFLTIQYVRIATDIAKRKNRLPNGAIIREGRLKSAITGYVAKKEELNKSFVPHSDYQAQYQDEDGNWYKNPDAECFKSPDEVKLLPDSYGKEKEVKKLLRKPPKLLDLASVSAVLEKRGYSTKKIEEYAEKLYQDGILSYPRTEDTVISQADLDALIPLVDDIKNVVGVKCDIDTSNFRSYLIGEGSHGANRPGLTVPHSLDDLDETYGKGAGALYKELAMSFLAGFGDDEEIDKHIFADESGKYTASYSVVTNPGWTAIRKVDKDDDDEDEIKSLKASKLVSKAYEKKAVRPPLANWKALDAALKKAGIGTGATRLSTYNEIKSGEDNRRLLDSNRGKLTVTTLGAMSEAVMAGTTLANFKVTKQVTDWMDDIEKGKVKEEQLLRMFDQMIDRDKKTMVANASKLEVFAEYKSHGKVSGNFEGKDIKISDGWGDHNFTEDEIKKLFNGETITIENKGKKFTGKLMEQELPNGRGKTYWGFGLIYDTYTGIYAPEGKEITFAKKAMGHEFSDAECEELLAGKTVKFEAYSEKKKKSYTAEVLLQYGPGYKDTKKKWRIVFKPFDKKKTKKRK